MVTALEHIYKNHCASRCLIEAASMLRRLDAERGELVKRVKKYRAKLEVDGHYAWKSGDAEMVRVELPFDQDEPYDGIDCRNETIKLLESQIAQLRAAPQAPTSQEVEQVAVALEEMAAHSIEILQRERELCERVAQVLRRLSAPVASQEVEQAARELEEEAYVLRFEATTSFSSEKKSIHCACESAANKIGVAAEMLRRLDAERGELLAECQAVGAHNMEQAITIANLTAQLRAAPQADVRSALEPLLTQVEEEENRVWARRHDEPQDAETLFVKLTWEQVNTIKAALSTLPTDAAVPEEKP